MQILFISEYFPPVIQGGGEINLISLAKALVKKGHTIHVLTAHFPHLPIYEEMAGINVYRHLKTGRSTSSIVSNLKRSMIFPRSVHRETKKFLQQHSVDIIHFMGASIIAAPELAKNNVPLFATIESYPALCPKGDRMYQGSKECTLVCSRKTFISCQRHCSEIGKAKNSLYIKYNPFVLNYVYHHYAKLNRALHYCHKIAISEYVAKLLQQHGHHSVIIPNILDLAPFQLKNNAGKWDQQNNTKFAAEYLSSRKPVNHQNQKEQLKQSSPTIVYLGSLINSKGPQILLEAIDGVSCHLDIYGDGPLKQPLQKMIDEQKLDATIHSPVPYEKIPEIYQHADVVVFPSLWPEPFGRITIEALAAGKKLIASHIGAIPETFQQFPEYQQGIGSLYSPYNIDELRTALRNALQQPPLTPAEKLSLCNTLRINYGEEVITTKLIEAYTPIASSKTRPASLHQCSGDSRIYQNYQG